MKFIQLMYYKHGLNTLYTLMYVIVYIGCLWKSTSGLIHYLHGSMSKYTVTFEMKLIQYVLGSMSKFA